MGLGMLVTAGVSLLGAAAFLQAARATRGESKHFATTAFYAVLSLFLFAAGGRLVFGYAGLQGIDRALFYLAGICAFGSTAPLAHTTYLLVTGRQGVAWAAATLHGAVGVVGIAAMFMGGLVAQPATFWATEWKMANPVAGLVLLLGILVPALVAGLALLAFSRYLDGKPRHRVVAVGASVLVVYVALTTDGLATFGGEVLVLERLLMAAGAIWVARAYGPS